jgi:hypothetical protein
MSATIRERLTILTTEGGLHVGPHSCTCFRIPGGRSFVPLDLSSNSVNHICRDPSWCWHHGACVFIRDFAANDSLTGLDLSILTPSVASSAEPKARRREPARQFFDAAWDTWLTNSRSGCRRGTPARRRRRPGTRRRETACPCIGSGYKREGRNEVGQVCPMPPRKVMAPRAIPRSTGAPRPVSEPSSDRASAKAMEMPAPTEAASPTRKVAQVSWVANAAANSGASVDTEPYIQFLGSGRSTLTSGSMPARSCRSVAAYARSRPATCQHRC